MLGLSAEENEMLVVEHLHYLERLAKFSLDLNMYGIPIVQETFQKLVSITGTRRFFQRAEAFERFLTMLSRRTMNNNYYLSRQFYEDVNAYGYTNAYDYDYARRVQAANTEAVNPSYFYNYNHRFHNESMLPTMNTANRYYRQPFLNQRDIVLNNSLDDIEEEDEEEEENDQEENYNNDVSFNSENFSPVSSLREEYSVYAPSVQHRRQRSRVSNPEVYRIRLPTMQRIPSNIPEVHNSAAPNSTNLDSKINSDLYPENHEVPNSMSDIRSFEAHPSLNLDTNDSNTNSTNNNNGNTNNPNIHNHQNNNNSISENSPKDTSSESILVNNLNKELKYNTPSTYTNININMKLYEDLNILTPPATEDDITLKEETKNCEIPSEEHNNNTNSTTENKKQPESQTILILSSNELESIDQNSYNNNNNNNNNNIPKEDIVELNESSNINTINKATDTIKPQEEKTKQSESISNNKDKEENNNVSYNSSSTSYSPITIRNQNYLLSRKRKYECQTTTMSFPQQKKLKN